MLIKKNSMPIKMKFYAHKKKFCAYKINAHCNNEIAAVSIRIW